MIIKVKFVLVLWETQRSPSVVILANGELPDFFPSMPDLIQESLYY